MTDDFVYVCSIDQIPREGPLAIEIGGRPVAIFKINDKCFAIEDICPHEGSSFSGGSLDGEVVTCPLHGWRLNVTTGASLEAPSIQVETYEVKIMGDAVHVRL
jgi:3-phenylpropionate/trans-cinnamate dioxygenase ferredoxin subunit